MTPDLLHFEARPLPRTPKVWLFDMDDTLYCASAGMFDAIHYEMRHWIAKALSIPVPEAQAKQEAYWAQYGATFIGLARHEGIDAEAFLNAVHHFDVEALARTRVPAAYLRRVLVRLPGKKFLLTNGPRDYAHRVLRHLAVEDVFSGEMTSSDMHVLGRWRCKPDKTLLVRAAAMAGVKPRDCVLVEDSLRNLRAAKSLGMLTVWCTGNAGRSRAVQKPVWVDSVISTAKDLLRLCLHKPVAEAHFPVIDGRYH
ncbi:MAG: pyrimidine 5'-nucleotidase [Duodenibacillus sp.]|nr:pyrimidine 5'-nucleotidase [Duodenibacillus sp.]